MLPYGDAWRRKRKMLHAHVHQGVIARYRPIQVASARRLARDILKVDADKEALPRAIRLNFGQTIMEAVYGIEVNDPESEFISLPEKVLDAFSVAFTPGRFLVDYFPFCECGTHWRDIILRRNHQ
jgi:cytochrome P450